MTQDTHRSVYANSALHFHTLLTQNRYQDRRVGGGLTLGRHKHLMVLLCVHRSLAESDIEGMEVIGEDGENLEDEDMETLDEAEREEEEDKMEKAAERADSPEEGTKNNIETQKPSQQQTGDRSISGLSR